MFRGTYDLHDISVASYASFRTVLNVFGSRQEQKHIVFEGDDHLIRSQYGALSCAPPMACSLLLTIYGKIATPRTPHPYDLALRDPDPPWARRNLGISEPALVENAAQWSGKTKARLPSQRIADYQL